MEPSGTAGVAVSDVLDVKRDEATNEGEDAMLADSDSEHDAVDKPQPIEVARSDCETADAAVALTLLPPTGENDVVAIREALVEALAE